MTDITFADISEFQATFDPNAYLRSGHDVIIVRTYNGYRADLRMPGRLQQLRIAKFMAVGLYFYLVKDRDPAQQAREFAAGIGSLKPNEFPIVDLEEGSGNQVPRAQAALAVLDGWAGFPATLYSGAYFYDAYLGGRSRWAGRPRWIAAYPRDYQPHSFDEPRMATFWQYSDRARFAGLGGLVDASIFHGSSRQFLAAVRPAPPAPPKPVFVPDASSVVVRKPDGSLESFVLDIHGSVWHRWQRRVPGGWSDWSSLGGPA